MRLFRIIGAMALLCAWTSAHAQSTNAIVVAACGTPPAAYVAGNNRQITQDTTGALCSNQSAAILPTGAATAALQNTINTTLGSPMQQTGGSVGIAPGSNIIGSVLSRTGSAAVTPTVTASTYTSGFVIGGIMTFSNIFGSAGSGVLQSASAVFNGSSQTSEIDLYIFKGSPSNGTYTDHAAPTWSAADAANLIGVVPLTLAKSGLGTMTVYTLAGEALALKPGGTNLYVVAVAAGALTTLGSTSGFTLTITALQD